MTMFGYATRDVVAQIPGWGHDGSDCGSLPRLAQRPFQIQPLLVVVHTNVLAILAAVVADIVAFNVLTWEYGDPARQLIERETRDTALTGGGPNPAAALNGETVVCLPDRSPCFARPRWSDSRNPTTM